MFETIDVRTQDGILQVTLDRPKVRNALNAAMRREIAAALAPVNADPTIRAVVITGAGDHAFCAGQDLGEAMEFDPSRASEWVAALSAFYASLRNLDKPCVAAVNGVAAGAGIQIALLCDIRVGHAGTRMGQPEINVGLASVLGAHLLDRAVGHARVVEMALTGRLMDGEECLALGLLNHLVGENAVVTKAFEIAHELAAKPATAMKLTKRFFREATQADLDATFERAARLQLEAYASGEPQSVMGRFLDKRRGG